MGTFMGHALPGTFFILFALWHILMISRRYFRSQQLSGKPYKSSTYFLSPCCCGGLPVECFLKIFCCSVGIIGETLTGVNKDWVFVNFGNSQHIVMFFFFGMTGVIEIMDHYEFHLPPNATYLMSMMAFVIEGLLFYFHLHGRKPMDVQIHQLLNFVVFLTIVSIGLDMVQKKNVIPAICRSFLTLLQGMWFWQAGFILYPPFRMKKWDWDDHDQMMIVTVLFCALAAISLLVTLFIWFAVSCCYGNFRKATRRQDQGYSTLGMEVLRGAKEDGGHLMSLQEEDSEEDEFFTSSPGRKGT